MRVHTAGSEALTLEDVYKLSLTYHIIHGVYFMHICNGVLRSLPFGLWTFLTNAILSPYCLEQIEAMSWGTEQISLIRTLPRQKDW